MKLVHWEPISNLPRQNDIINEESLEISTTDETYYTNERNIRALYPNESEAQINNRIYKNLKSNPEYNR